MILEVHALPDLARYDAPSVRAHITGAIRDVLARRDCLDVRGVVDACWAGGFDGVMGMIELVHLLREGRVRALSGGLPIHGETILCLVGEWPLV